MSLRTPKYRLHKPTGQAVVTLNGRDIYLGKYGSTTSKAEYDRLVAEWLAQGRQLAATADATVVELVVRYWKFADGYYVKNGRPTSEAGLIHRALGTLRDLYGHTMARDFGPVAVKTVRQAFVDQGLCRRDVNRFTGLVVRFFKWCVENELVPPSVHHGLQAVPGLRKGRCEVRESPPVRPVHDSLVDAVRPFVPRQVWAMIELQRLTGMRPGETCMMRTCDIDTSGRIWDYRPREHKNEHHDRERQVYIGPQAQAILRPWLRPEMAAYLFSPREAMEELAAERRRNRKTPMTPSQEARQRVAKPEKVPGDRYTPNSYRQAIVRACALAFPHPEISAIDPDERTSEQQAELKRWDREHAWHANQLRHNAATRLRKEFGVDAARVILGHSSPVVTEVYAELDREKALHVMELVG